MRSQIGVITGLCIWNLLIETILIGNIPSAGKFTRCRGRAIAARCSPDPARLIAPALGLLAAYAVPAAVLGARAITRRDIA